MAFVLPSFNLADIITFAKVIKIRTANGALLPFHCISNNVSRSWRTPQHPTDSNVVISDTIYKEPITISLQGHVSAKSINRFLQLIEGSTERDGTTEQNVFTNIFGFNELLKGQQGPLGLYSITLLGNIYDNMALTSLTRNETPEENSGYAVSMDFQQVMIVEDDETRMTKEKVAQAQAADSIDSGKILAKPRNSLLYDGMNQEL